MKNKILKAPIVILIMVLLFSSCTGKAGAQTINSATELKAYLDRQPANSPDKPIKVAMKANEMMIGDIAKAIDGSGKYVSLDLSGSPLTEIPEWAFLNCKTLANIIIPNSVTRIGQNAFNGCTNLASITIPNSVTSIGEVAFQGCDSLTSVTIPNSVTIIQGGTFSNCTGLVSIAIPEGVTSIESYVFWGCYSLASITIPGSVTSIREYAFVWCTSLTSVTFQSTIASNNFNNNSFDGDLKNKYLAGGVGTYTRPNGGRTWTKQ